MIDLSKYGFKCGAAFKRTRGLDRSKFDEMMQDPNWKVRKQVLHHSDCPLDLRDKARTSKLWYERGVAMMSKAAPPGYFHLAKGDPDPRIRRLYSGRMHYLSWDLQCLLAQLGVQWWEDEEE
jgi:hypothetical protein